MKNKRILVITCGAAATVILVICIVAARSAASNRRAAAAAVEASIRAAQNTTVRTYTTQSPTTTTEPEPEPPYVPVKFTEDMYPLQHNERWGVVSNNNEIIIDFQYTTASSDFLNGYWCVDCQSYTKTCSLIDANGRPVFSEGNFDGYSDGLYMFYTDRGDHDIWTEFYDDSGNLEYATKGYSLRYSCGLIPVQRDNYFGFRDQDGETVIPEQFNDISDGVHGKYRVQLPSNQLGFIAGRIGVSVNDTWGVIDTQGDYVIPLSKDISAILYLDKDFIIIARSGKTELYDHDGKILSTLDGVAGSFATLQNGAYLTLSCKGRIIVNKAGTVVAKDKYAVGMTILKDEWVETNGNFINALGDQFFADNEGAGPLGTTTVSENLQLILKRTRSPYVFRIYDFNQKKLAEISGVEDFKLWNEKYAIARDKSRDGGLQHLIPLAGGKKYTFNEIEVVNENTLIVHNEDGTYYGVFVIDQLAIPMEYNSISSSNGQLKLQKGPVATTIEIAWNGTITEIE